MPTDKHELTEKERDNIYTKTAAVNSPKFLKINYIFVL